MYPGNQPNYNYQQQGNWGNPNVNYGQPIYGNQVSVDTFNGFKIYDEFKIKEKLLTLGMDMRLLLNDQQFGFIKQKVFSFGEQFDLLDNTDNVVVTAKEKVFQIGRDFQIFDNMGMKIGSITEEVLKSMFSLHRKYTVRDANGMQVGSTKELQVGSKSSIEIFNQMGTPQAEFSEQWLSFVRQKWNVRFYGYNIDRRLLIFFPSIISRRQQITQH